MEDQKNTFKLVAVVNKRLEPGVAMNAVAHLAAGIVNVVGVEGRDKLHFLDFIDKDGQVHPSISALSLIVLRGTSANICTVRQEATRLGLPFVDFTNTMTGGTYGEQLDNTQQTSTFDLKYYGVMIFGQHEEVDRITRRYSLWP